MWHSWVTWVGLLSSHVTLWRSAGRRVGVFGGCWVLRFVVLSDCLDMSSSVQLTYFLFNQNILLCGIYFCVIVPVCDCYYRVVTACVVYVTFCHAHSNVTLLHLPVANSRRRTNMQGISANPINECWNNTTETFAVSYSVCARRISSARGLPVNYLFCCWFGWNMVITQGLG